MSALRAIHFAAVIALFGSFVFFLYVARPVFLRRWLLRAAAGSLLAALASGALWLAMEAATMSGMPVERALNPDTLGAVLTQTLFGRVWMVRFGLATGLGAALFLARRRIADGNAAITGACGSLAGALLATLAWAGHAAAERGADRIIHLSMDALHLLAAGAWLGALPALAFVLARARRVASAEMLELAGDAARRFSTLGVVSVGALVLTGVANAWYTVGSIPAIVGTGYGRLLLFKLLLFGAMLTLAAINRIRLTPRVAKAGEASSALQQLRRNAIAETALGIAVVGIVGALGIAVPAAHVQTLWPFPYTLDWNATEDSGAMRTAAIVSIAGALAACALTVFGAFAHRRPMTAFGAAGLLGVLAVLASLLAVPAHPSTYFRSPSRYDVASIAAGSRLYIRHCVACHGDYGYGDGPAAASLAMKPANLTEHLFHHREGDLLWWLQHGIAGTPMPGFGDRIDERQLWSLLDFLRAQAEAEGGRTMNASVDPWRPIVAPEFPFQIGSNPQESLGEQRGRHVVLLVLYTLPRSLARLRALSASRYALDRAGVRVIATPTNEATASQGVRGIDASLLADFDPGLTAVYTMYSRVFGQTPVKHDHIEFLIDREGYLRARWIADAQPGWDEIRELLRQVTILKHETPRPAAGKGHVH